MVVPKSFKLFGQTINIEYDNKLYHKNDAEGLAVYRENKILLQKETDGIIRKKEMIERAFFHELMHFIFYQIGEIELMNNEKIVDLIGSLLHQYMVTKEGQLK